MLSSGHYMTDTHQLTAVVAACIRPVQHQITQNSSTGWGGAPKASPLAEELLAADSWLEKESHYAPVDVPIPIYMVSTNWI